MLLSIGMIVKNEENNLERCLSSLKPILDNVDSELIIADTGSTDKTVEIAKKFTDKVYFFEWINDFSAARNFTLEKSVGEWFLFLDADEAFSSCDEIIHFFNSGEHKSYGAAAFTIRSYTDESNPNRYSDFSSVRFAKRSPNLKFVNKIHEEFTGARQPVRGFSTIVQHYGYIFENNGKPTELAYEKSKRNLDFLLESLNEQPIGFNVYREIAECYNAVGDTENAMKYIDMGLEKLDHHDISITQYYRTKAQIFLREKRYTELSEFVDKYFAERNDFANRPIATDMDMYAICGMGCFLADDHEKTIECYTHFFKLYDEYIHGRLNTVDLFCNSNKINERTAQGIYARFLFSCIKLKKYYLALENLKSFPVELFQYDRLYMLLHFRDRSEILMHTGWKGIKGFAAALDDENRKRFFRILRRKLIYTDKPKDLFKAMSEFKTSIPELGAAVEIYASYLNGDLKFEQIKSFLDSFGALGNTDMLFLMLKCGMDISAYLTADGYSSRNSAQEFYADFPDQTALLDEYDVEKIPADAAANAASLYLWAASEAMGASKSIVQLFESYGKLAARWHNEFPNEENVPDDIRAGIIVHSIAEAAKRQDKEACIAEKDKLITAFPNFKNIVSKYCESIESNCTPQE